MGANFCCLRQILQQMASVKAGKWQSGVGKTFVAEPLGYTDTVALPAVAGMQRIRNEYCRWSSESGRAQLQQTAKQ